MPPSVWHCLWHQLISPLLCFAYELLERWFPWHPVTTTVVDWMHFIIIWHPCVCQCIHALQAYVAEYLPLIMVSTDLLLICFASDLSHSSSPGITLLLCVHAVSQAWCSCTPTGCSWWGAGVWCCT